MLRTIRSKLTYANVMATIALFIALGGGAYAATTLKPNSVGTKQIKKSAVTGQKLAKNAVDGSKVKNGSLTGADINLGTLPKVNSAASADNAAHAATADNAGHASSADNSSNASHATNADNASSADKLGGTAASQYVQYGPLPAGRTETGVYSFWGSATAASTDEGTALSFPMPLPAALDSSHVHFVASTGSAPPECPGSPASPQAAGGNLCVYEDLGANRTFMQLYKPSVGQSGADTSGFGMWFESTGTGSYFSYGTWAVTA
jgi:hypothetical protein